jgi:DNA-binding NtrC family response regulator
MAMAAHPDAKPSAPAAQARRLLLIDDDFNLLLALAVIFRLQLPSVTVSTAVSGPIGLHRVQQEQYDLIVCDVRMPGMDGLTFLQEVKKLPFHPPVVLISGQGDPEIVARAQQHGAVAFIQKPFDRDQFLTTVAKLLRL